MTSDAERRLLDLLDRTASTWESVLPGVTSEGLSQPSVCPGWTVYDLVNHVHGGGHRYALLVSGASASATAETRDLDHVRPDPVAAFHRWQDPLRAQLLELTPTDWGRLVDHPVGQRSVQVLVQMRTLDLLLHAWDLARSLGVEAEIDDDLAAVVHEEASGVIQELRGMGLYAEPVTTATSSPIDRLLAVSGRRAAAAESGN